MSATTDRRAALRAEARKRERETVPKLRAKLRTAKQRRAKRLQRCKQDCQQRRDKVRAQAEAARKALRARLAAAKQTARELCTVCKVGATGAELDTIDTALAQLEKERATIRQLRSQAAGLVDPRGQAAGRRSAELRAELEDQVSRNVADDAELAALWDAQSNRYRRFAPTQRATMTERFLEWVQSHPEALDELRARQEVAWEREASELLERWPRRAPIGDLTDRELDELHRDHDRAHALVGDEPDADTLAFAELVHDAARDPSTTRSGSGAYLRSVYATLRRQRHPITWPQFKDALLAAHARKALRLQRAELVPATLRQLVKDSTVPYRATAFHLVQVPEATPF